MVDLGKRLKDLRKEKGLTQQQVADRVWVSKAVVSSYEIGTRTPSYEVLIKLAKLFGVSTDFLLGVSPKRVINADNLTEKQITLVTQLVKEIERKS